MVALLNVLGSIVTKVGRNFGNTKLTLILLTRVRLNAIGFRVVVQPLYLPISAPYNSKQPSICCDIFAFRCETSKIMS